MMRDRETEREKDKRAAKKVKVEGAYLSFLYMFNQSACPSVMMKVVGIGKEKKVKN
jgi:hypothetical protein